MADSDNPVIDCTQMQLAFVAWQLAKSDFCLDHASLTPTDEFKSWWDSSLGSLGGLSLRDLCLRAFLAACPTGALNLGAIQHFRAWWQSIVDAPPQVVGLPPMRRAEDP